MAWRPYIISNKYGKRVAMRDTKLYKTEDDAIKSMKVKNKAWMKLNYDQKYTKNSDFEYGAIYVGNKKYNYKVGSKGNEELLKYHDSKTKVKTKPAFNFKF